MSCREADEDTDGSCRMSRQVRVNVKVVPGATEFAEMDRKDEKIFEIGFSGNENCAGLADRTDRL